MEREGDHSRLLYFLVRRPNTVVGGLNSVGSSLRGRGV